MLKDASSSDLPYTMLLNSSIQQVSTFQESHIAPYTTVESLLEDVSRRMATSNLSRRHSRGSAAQKASGGSMRIVKPSSASCSPRNSGYLGRRKTVIGGGLSKMVDANTNRHATASKLQVPSRTSRPVSWHSTTIQPSQGQSQHLAPNVLKGIGRPNDEWSMTPILYSGYTSPASTFSPVTLPYTAYDQYPFPEETPYFNAHGQSGIMYAPYQPSTIRHLESTYRDPRQDDASALTQFDWDHFVAHGFSSTTSPPTPENYVSARPQQSFQVEDGIPFNPLDGEDTGEELVALGLYDAPEKTPSFDPTYNGYRSTIMQYLAPLPPHGYMNQPTGKGLKLEEAYVPPSPREKEDDLEDEAEEESIDEPELQQPTATTRVESDSILAKFAGSSFR